MNRTSQCVFQPRPACPMTETGRTISTPAASAGTRIIVPRRCCAASGSVIAKRIAKSAPSAPLENHLCPSITHSSPSRIARVRRSVGSEPATSGSVIAKKERLSPATSGRRNCAFCSSVPNRWRISAFPASGAWQPKSELRVERAADLLVEARVVEEPEARAAGLGRDVRRPESRFAGASAQLLEQREGGVVLALDRRLVRVDVLVHERAVTRPRLDVRWREERRRPPD